MIRSVYISLDDSKYSSRYVEKILIYSSSLITFVIDASIHGYYYIYAISIYSTAFRRIQKF